MRFDILTLFPSLFSSVFSESIVKRARERGLVDVRVHNIRDYAHDKHHVTDDMPYGGGGGMVMKVEPIVLALEDVIGGPLPESLHGDGAPTVALMTPGGEVFSQSMAREFEQSGHVVMVCGRYEGVDERVSTLGATREVSIGDYVLSGGEIPAMVIVEAVTRLVPGVLGDMRAVVEDSHSSGLIEYPQYTRPAEFRGLCVPEVLLSGDHARIARWRRERALERTAQRRPDMLGQARLSRADLCFLSDAELLGMDDDEQ